MNIEELRSIKIEPVDNKYSDEIKANFDALAKPIDGLGELERLVGQIGAIKRSDRPVINKRAVLIFAADNGVVDEGVTQCGQEVTRAVANLLTKGLSTLNYMAASAKADVISIDVGINSKDVEPLVVDKKVRFGTGNILHEDAMSIEETLKAINAGIDSVKESLDKGYEILAVGEMSIGNTTTATALEAVLLDVPVEKIISRGAGLSDTGLNRKAIVINEAINRARKELLEMEEDLDEFEYTLLVLSKLGGLDIAAMAGAYIGGAIYQVPMIADGVISLVAALIAVRLFSSVKGYILPSHKGRGEGVSLLLNELSFNAMIDANMALGEGTGAVCLFPLLDIVMNLYNAGQSFASSNIDPYQRF